MAFINVKRKTIKLPNGMKINFNKDSISYTVSNGKASYTYNPKKKMETKNVKLSKDLSLIAFALSDVYSNENFSYSSCEISLMQKQSVLSPSLAKVSI